MHGDSGDMQPRRMQGKVECVPANQMLHALVCGAEICVAIKLPKYLAVHLPSQGMSVRPLLAWDALVVKPHGFSASVEPKKMSRAEDVAWLVHVPSNVSYRGLGRLVFLPCGA